MTTPRLHQEDPAAAAEAVREIADRIRKEVGKVIVGQEEVLEEVLLAIFCGGHVIIDRSRRERAVSSLTRAARQVREGTNVIIFPEGTRTVPGAEPAYFAAGISALAKGIEAPIVPVATNAGLCWPGRGLKRSKGKIVYEILPPIPAGLPRQQLMARLQSELESATDALVAEGRTVQGRLAR